MVRKSKRNCTICNGCNAEIICIGKCIAPTYIRGGLADGVLGGEAGLPGSGAGIGPSGHVPGITLVLDVRVVQSHGGGGGTAVNDG